MTPVPHHRGLQRHWPATAKERVDELEQKLEDANDKYGNAETCHQLAQERIIDLLAKLKVAEEALDECWRSIAPDGLGTVREAVLRGKLGAILDTLRKDTNVDL